MRQPDRIVGLNNELARTGLSHPISILQARRGQATESIG